MSASLFLVDTIDEAIEFIEKFLRSVDVNLVAGSIDERNLEYFHLFRHRFLHRLESDTKGALQVYAWEVGVLISFINSLVSDFSRNNEYGLIGKAILERVSGVSGLKMIKLWMQNLTSRPHP